MTTYELIDIIGSTVTGLIMLSILFIIFYFNDREIRMKISQPDYKEIKLKILENRALMETQRHERKMKRLEK